MKILTTNNTIIIGILPIKTPLGLMISAATTKGICWLEFNKNELLEESINQLKKELNAEVSKTQNPHLSKLKKELDNYFNGSLQKFSVTLDPIGTPFQNQVWNKLVEIPYGETTSYEQQTIDLGNLKAIRAVASANGKNKIAILIPCHRVIGKNGSLTGYAGGLSKKKWLLDFENKNSGKSYQLALAF